MFDETPVDPRIRARVGLLLIASIVAVSLTVFFFDAIERATKEGPRILVLVDAAPGLTAGSTVWVAGRPVGRVVAIRFRPPGTAGPSLAVEAVLDRGVEDYLRADARAAITPAALLEPVVIAIDPGSPDAPRWDGRMPFRVAEGVLEPEDLLAMSDTLRRAGAALADRAGAFREALEGGGSLAELRAHPDVLEDARAQARAFGDMMVRDYPSGTAARLAADTLVGRRLRTIRERLAILDTLPGRARARTAFAEASRSLDAFAERLSRLGRRLEARWDAGWWMAKSRGRSNSCVPGSTPSWWR